ncbi:MAG: peptide chain release factor N(5)-glutamine methyltransferase [Lachnospiraceae bacterium]|nr:peptide chain release factor N(5)-glutamine methyltransferase [Lachnospiraceae bacterium]MDE6999884.1 peptide chain release factor N(5)-glutamine methyltransferase [Lachnospiraceae bacterium]
MTYGELYEYGKRTLEAAGVAEAALDARLLLEYICHTDRNELIVHADRCRSGMEEQFYTTVIEKRAERVPLQHITGEQEFMGLSFRVNEHTLIPRQDTEILVEEAMRHLGDGMRILDMCTGSGCILLSLLKYSNECEGIGVDISEKALEVARENAARLQLPAAFLAGDLFAPLESFEAERAVRGGKHGVLFDMVVANPPYIETGVIAGLMPEVRAHEPLAALDGGEDGLAFYRRITTQAPAYMQRGAYLFFEIGSGQAQAVTALMQEAGFGGIEVLRDYAGLDRVVYGTKAY